MISNSLNRYLESQLQFKKQEFVNSQTQIKELEMALVKARSLNAQQQELYTQVVESCNIAECRIAEVERELAEVREETANRSTISEAQERNQQWKKALERVGELEQQLAEREEDCPAIPQAPAIPLPPVLTFADQSEMDAVASLVVRLQRVREERDTLRGNVEFLNLELRAKEAAFEHQIEAQRSRLLQLLQASEQDIEFLLHDLAAYEARFAKLQQENSLMADRDQAVLLRMQTVSTAALLALQRTHSQLETETAISSEKVEQLQSQLEEEQHASEAVIEGLKDILHKRDASFVEIQNQYSDLNNDYREKSRIFRDLQDKIVDLEDERQKLMEAVEEEAGNARLMQRELDARGMDYARLEESYNTLREYLHETKQEAEQLRNNHMTSLAQQDPESKDALERHIEELEGRVTRRNEQIGIQQNDIRRLDMNLRIAENAVDEMRTEVDELRRQVVWLEDDASNVRQERNIAQRELDAARSELDSLHHSVDQKDALLKVNDEAHFAQLATLVEIISTSCVQVRFTTSALQTANSEIEELQSRFNNRVYIHRKDSLTDDEELTTTKPTVDALPPAQQQAAQRLVEFTRKTELLETDLQIAIDRGDALARQMQRTMDLAREEVRERMETMEECIGTLSGEVESLEERLGEAQQQIQVVMDQNGELTNQNYDLESKMESMAKERKAKIEELEGKVRGLEEEIKQARDDLNEKSRMVLEYQDELDQLRQELSEALEAAENSRELKARAETLQQEKTSLVEQVNQLSSGINERKLEIEVLLRRMAEIDSLKEQLRQGSEKLHQSEATRSQLENDLSVLRTETDQVQQRLVDKDAALQAYQFELDSASKRSVAFHKA